MISVQKNVHIYNKNKAAAGVQQLFVLQHSVHISGLIAAEVQSREGEPEL